MRTLYTGERSIIGGARVKHDIKVEIQDEGANWVDWSAYCISGSCGESKDSPVASADLNIRRAAGTSSLAPLMSASPLNQFSGHYSPAIDKGRRVRISTATVTPVTSIDNFDKADSAVTMSSTQDGIPWINQSGVFGIQTSLAYVPSGTGNFASYIPKSADGVLTCDVKLSGTAARANVGLNFRNKDTNLHLILSLSTVGGVNPVRLYKNDSGYTSLQESATPALTAGNTYTIEVTLVGINIKVKVNGTQYINYNLSAPEQAKFLSPIGTGLWIGKDASNDDGGSRWNNFSFIPALGIGDYREMFVGRVDSVDWSQDPIRVGCSDEGSWLQDTQIETEGTYGTAGGQAVETAMQNILNAWPSGKGIPALYTPVSPAWNIKTYTQSRNKVMDAVRDLALQIAWDLRFRYDASHVSRLTFMDPNRTNVTPVDSIGPTEYSDVRALAFNIANIRNTGLVKYVTPGGGASTATSTDATSVTKHGRRYIELPSARNVDSSTEANKYVSGVVSDLADSGAEQEIEMLYYWPVQLYDLLTFVANGVHYDQNQNLAVGSYRHSFQNGFITTAIQVAGRIIGAYNAWIQRLPGRSFDGIGNVDFRGTAYDNKNQDYVDDGSTYPRTPQYAAGDNMVDNGNFEASAGLVNGFPPGWILYGGTGTFSYETAAPYSGLQSAQLVASAAGYGIRSLRRWKVRPGEIWKGSVVLKKTGASAVAEFDLCFRDAAGTGLAFLTLSTTSGTFVEQHGTITVPAGAVYMDIVCVVSGAAGTAWYDDIVALRVRGLDDEVADGSSYNKTIASRVNAGRPLIDFYENIHFNEGLLQTRQSPTSLLLSVTNALTTGGAIGQWQVGNNISFGIVEFDVLSTGGLVDILLYDSVGGTGPNGYIFRFDGRSGQRAGQLLKIVNGSWTAGGGGAIGSIAGGSAVNPAALTGWHHVRVMMRGGGTVGRYDIWVDGVWHYTAVDNTYACNSGALYYGYEVTAGMVICPAQFGPELFRCRLRNTTSQTITNSTGAQVTWDTEDYDVGGLHSGSSSIITIPTGGNHGKWLFIAQVPWDINTTGYRMITIRKNGGDVIQCTALPLSTGGTEGLMHQIVYEESSPAVGDQFEVGVFQNSGANRTINPLNTLSVNMFFSASHGYV